MSMVFYIFYKLYCYFFRIYCVNVLKTLFSNSALAEGVLAHVEVAFRVCFIGCASSNWSIRNAHCQLFAALTYRVFGVPKSAQRTLHVQHHSKLSSFIFFSRFLNFKSFNISIFYFL